jgi:hypothetical protein
LIHTGTILYRRVNGGNWEVILTLTIACAAAGVPGNEATTIIGGFCLNPLIPGRINATFGSDGVNQEPHGYYLLSSDDYGDTWTCPTGGQFHSHPSYTYYLASVIAYDDILHISCVPTFSGNYDFFSENQGVDIHRITNRLSTGSWGTIYHWSPVHDPRKIWYYGNITIPNTGIFSTDVGVFDVPNNHWDDTQTFLDDEINPIEAASIWFDPNDVLHQRAINHTDGHIFVTTDGWTTHSVSLHTDPKLLSFNPIDINGEIIVGLVLDHASHEHHCIGVMTDETDAVPVGIAGSNCNVAPYTDSIPDTCGGVCQFGVQAFME